MSEKKRQEYTNSFIILSATTIDIKKKQKTKKTLQNPAPRAVAPAAVTVSAEKYWDHVHGSDS